MMAEWTAQAADDFAAAIELLNELIGALTTAQRATTDQRERETLRQEELAYVRERTALVVTDQQNVQRIIRDCPDRLEQLRRANSR